MSAPSAGPAVRSRAWLAYLVAMLVVTAAYLTGPIFLSGPLYIVIGASTAVALLVGARLHQPGNRLPWILFAFGQALSIVGDIVMYNYEELFGQSAPYPSLADVFYFAFYPMIIAGVLVLIRRRYVTPDRASLIDALMVTVAVGALSWTFLMAPYAHDTSLTLATKLTVLAYPVMDVLLLGVVFRLAVVGGYRGAASVLFSIGVMGLLLIDGYYGWSMLQVRYEAGTVLESGWARIGVPDEKALFYLLFGTAALHPSMRNLSRHAPDPDVKLTASRLAVLGAAILAAPAMVILRTSLDLPVDVTVMTAASVVMFALVLIRMAGLVRRNEETRAREVTLRTAGEALVTATTRGQISSAALIAARALIAQDAVVRLYLPGERPDRLVAADATDVPVDALPAVPLASLSPETWATLGARRVAYLRGYERVIPAPPQGSASECVSPLFMRDELVGLLVVFPLTPLTPAVAESLGSLTAQVAMALESATLAEKALQQRSEARLTALVERASDVIWVLGADTAVHYVSPSVAHVLGRSPESVLDAHLGDLLGQRSTEGLVAFVHEVAALSPGATAATETRVRHRDGSWLDIEATGTNLLADPSVGGIVLNIRDVTERTRTQRELVAAHTEAVEASRLKSEFVANMSHEIRTPLNAVIGLSALMRETALDADQAQYLDAVRTSADALMTLVDDILDFSKIEAGRLELEEHVFDVRSILDGVITSLAHSAHAKGLQLSSRVDDLVPAFVRGDSTRVHQVLSNLVSNAIKFTPAGEVSVEVSGALSEDQFVLLFAVSDTGIGLEPGAFKRIFDSFAQADGSTTRRYGGTGLGLAICKRLVTLMAGEIGVESAPGAGSTFWFTVPVGRVQDGELPAENPSRPDVAASIAPVPAPARASAPVAAPVSATGDRRILLVEDHPVNQIVAARMLELRGCQVDIAANGLEAVEMSAGHCYDLIFMDCQMPELDGYEATRRIRAREAGGPRTPIVAMTANVLKGDRERCLVAGMDDYLAKPVHTAELDGVIARLVPRQARPTEAPTGPETVGPAAVDLPVFDPAAVESLCDDPDTPVLGGLVELFAEQAHDQIAKLADALTSQDRELIGTLAHSLKGSAAVLGAVRMAELCERICRMAPTGPLSELHLLHAALEPGLGLAVEALQRFMGDPAKVA